MSGFTLHLLSADQYRRVDDVQSFVGEDASGELYVVSLAGSVLTPLVYGLARFRAADGAWQYLATVGGIAYYSAGELSVSTRRFLVNADFDAIRAALARELAAEEAKTRDLRDSLHRIEEAMLRRLWQLGRGGEAA